MSYIKQAQRKSKFRNKYKRKAKDSRSGQETYSYERKIGHVL